MSSEDEYNSHLISTHSDTPWLPCAIAAKENCKLSFPSKELQSLHNLLFHKHSSETLKHLSSVKYKMKETSSSVGSKEDFATVRLIVRLYPYLRGFKIPIFDPYLASITLFNNATITCSDLDRVLASLSLSEIETKATVKDDVQQSPGAKEKSNFTDSCFQSTSLTTNMPLTVPLQTDDQPRTDELHVSSSNVASSTAADVQQTYTTVTATSGQRPLLLSMPLLTDLQPTTNVEQLPVSCSDMVENSNVYNTSTNHNEVMPIPEFTSTGANLQESHNNVMFLDGNSFCSDNVCDVFDVTALSSSTDNVASGNLDSDNCAGLLSDDILDLANDPACVRDLMESVELSYLLPPDFLEPSSTDWTSLTVLDNDSVPCSSNEPSTIPNFAHLTNPLADLTFESLSAIPDSILESTLQMMIENSNTSCDVIEHTSTTAAGPSRSVTTSSSTPKGESGGNGNKRGSSDINVVNQKRKKALQLSKV